MSNRDMSAVAFLAWWRDSLLTTLPVGLRNRVQGLKSTHDFIVMRQGEDAIVLDERGTLVEARPLAGEVEIPQPETATSGTIVTLTHQAGTASRPAGHPAQGDETGPAGSICAEDATARIVDLHLFKDADATQQMTSITRTRLDPETGPEEETLLFFFDHGELKTADSASETPLDITLDPGQQAAGETPLVTEAEKELLARYLRKGRCLYAIPREFLLSLVLEYPAEAESSLDTALRYDLEKHIPMAVSEAAYFHAVERGDEGRLKVHVEVVKKELFERLKQELEVLLEAGLDCSTDILREHGGKTLPMSEARSRSLLRQLFSRRNLPGWGNLLLLIALLAVPYWFITERHTRVEPVSAGELARARHIQSMKRQMELDAQMRGRLVASVAGQPRVLEILDAMSEHLDKQAWLSDFLLEENSLRIRGEADSATRVVDDLNGTGLFEDIRFVSSIVKNAMSGKETFEITMKVR